MQLEGTHFDEVGLDEGGGEEGPGCPHEVARDEDEPGEGKRDVAGRAKDCAQVLWRRREAQDGEEERERDERARERTRRRGQRQRRRENGRHGWHALAVSLVEREGEVRTSKRDATDEIDANVLLRHSHVQV